MEYMDDERRQNPKIPWHLHVLIQQRLLNSRSRIDYLNL